MIFKKNTAEKFYDLPLICFYLFLALIPSCSIHQKNQENSNPIELVKTSQELKMPENAATKSNPDYVALNSKEHLPTYKPNDQSKEIIKPTFNQDYSLDDKNFDPEKQFPHEIKSSKPPIPIETAIDNVLTNEVPKKEEKDLEITLKPESPQVGLKSKYLKPLKWLRNGNLRYVRGRFRRDGTQSKDRQRLLIDQHPHSTIWSCSDSRIPPEVIFDQKLGEIFVVRSLELQLDLGVQRALESASTHLNIPLIVIIESEFCQNSASVEKSLLENSQILRDLHDKNLLHIALAYYNQKTGVVKFK